jgi:surface antigen
VNRTVGATLRLTVGGGAIFAFGFGALASAPQLPISAAASAAVVPLASPIEHFDEAVPHPARTAAMIYVLATPQATATVIPPPAPPAMRPLARVAASVPARAAGPVAGGGNGFSYGYCTWWVANKRSIPWRGNAAQWWWNARPFAAEGPAPQPGAVMVMGVSGTSPQGHVGYVESVNSDGSFVVSEMNWWGVPGGGWNRVDYRKVTSLRGVLGFIY